MAAEMEVPNDQLPEATTSVGQMDGLILLLYVLNLPKTKIPPPFF